MIYVESITSIIIFIEKISQHYVTVRSMKMVTIYCLLYVFIATNALGKYLKN